MTKLPPRHAVQTYYIAQDGKPLADSHTREWLAAKGFDLAGIISWWDASDGRHFTQDMAPPRPMLKAGAFKRVTA